MKHVFFLLPRVFIDPVVKMSPRFRLATTRIENMRQQPSAIRYPLYDYPLSVWTNLLSGILCTTTCYLLSAGQVYDIRYKTIRPYDYTLIRLYAIQGRELKSKLIAYCLLLTAYCLLQGIPSGHGHTIPSTLELFTCENNWKRNGNPRATCCLVTGYPSATL